MLNLTKRFELKFQLKFLTSTMKPPASSSPPLLTYRNSSYRKKKSFFHFVPLLHVFCWISGIPFISYLRQENTISDMTTIQQTSSQIIRRNNSILRSACSAKSNRHFLFSQTRHIVHAHYAPIAPRPPPREYEPGKSFEYLIHSSVLSIVFS